jgi:hypothetical protein
VWRYLRKSDQASIRRLLAEEAKASKRSKTPTAPTGPPPPAEGPPPATTITSPASYDRDRLKDYVAAFVLAGLDPQVAAETEFFAERVDYFGERAVTREKIRQDCPPAKF